MKDISSLKFRLDCIVAIKKYKIKDILSIKKDLVIELDTKLNSNSYIFIKNEKLCDCKVIFNNECLSAKIF